MKNANKDSQKVQFHPFVRAQLKLSLQEDVTPVRKDINIIQIRIVKPDALEQVVLEMNLLKNKN